ncbi:MAG: hypothetical protein E7Z65_06395 [Thermoplasmata archaeon]|nr:hypothetical protein [Thermoplasmata archaeon]
MDRFAQLRNRPQYEFLKDDVLETMLAEALQDFLLYTNRKEDPGERADSVIIDMAAIKLNMLGAEGSSMVKEGEVTRQWDSLPESLRMKLDAFRRPMFP